MPMEGDGDAMPMEGDGDAPPRSVWRSLPVPVLLNSLALGLSIAQIHATSDSASARTNWGMKQSPRALSILEVSCSVTALVSALMLACCPASRCVRWLVGLCATGLLVAAVGLGFAAAAGCSQAEDTAAVALGLIGLYTLGALAICLGLPISLAVAGSHSAGLWALYVLSSLDHLGCALCGLALGAQRALRVTFFLLLSH